MSGASIPRAAALGAVVLGALVAPARAHADDAPPRAQIPAARDEVELAPSPRGAFGAWLLAGPFKPGPRPLLDPPEGVDERALGARLGAELGGPRALGKKTLPPAKWELAASASGPVDVRAAFGDLAKGKHLVAYAAGTLRIAHAGRYALLLGIDDGVRVAVDGRWVFARDKARPVRADDDVIPLDLTAGDHAVVLKLRQRDGAWAFRARVTNGELAPAGDVSLVLPGGDDTSARDLAGRMASVTWRRTFAAGTTPPAYRPSLEVRFAEGAPRGVDLPVKVSLEGTFDLDAGGVAVDGPVTEVDVALPSVAPTSKARALVADVAGHTFRAALPARPAEERALAHATSTLERVPPTAPFLREGSRTSVAFLAARLARLLERGDEDGVALAAEAKELDELARAMDQGRDPFDGRTGPMRRALDTGHGSTPTELGLYVPRSYAPGSGRRYPLVVGLHGLNGRPVTVLRWIFGKDDPKMDTYWKDRHLGELPEEEAFILAPNAYGNSMYREVGEDDVARVVAWAMRTFPIDPARVTITGPSMGGIGAAAIPLHSPEVYAASAPLCGYHSVFVRRDVAGKLLRPWEKFLAEERSNAEWADNGQHLPLFVVHGTRDLPVENSNVLIERYEKLKFSVRHEHPDMGHEVWRPFFEEMKGLEWLLAKRRDLHPRTIRFKTARTRFGSAAWVHVDELASEAGWGEVEARVQTRSKIRATTRGVEELRFERDPALVAPGAVDVELDGARLSFDAGEPLVARRTGASWQKGGRADTAWVKRGRVTGPLRDPFHEPLLFVYADGGEARVNEEVARAFARTRAGVELTYPVMSDTEFLARGEPLANDRALFLVGRTNQVAAALAQLRPFPVQIADGSVTLGGERFTGAELGAAFVHPNPARPDRYVVVVAGADAPGTLRATSLPDLLPDFVVWDGAVAPARGQIVLGGGALRAGGFFGKDWSLPRSFTDPYARRVRPTAQGEHDAEPYLP